MPSDTSTFRPRHVTVGFSALLAGAVVGLFALPNVFGYALFAAIAGLVGGALLVASAVRRTARWAGYLFALVLLSVGIAERYFGDVENIRSAPYYLEFTAILLAVALGIRLAYDRYEANLANQSPHPPRAFGRRG